MKTTGRWVQGYNVQAAVNAEQIVIGYATTQDHNDVNQFRPMIKAAQFAAGTAGIEHGIALALADAGYWSDDNATATGPNRLIATTKDQTSGNGVSEGHHGVQDAGGNESC